MSGRVDSQASGSSETLAGASHHGNASVHRLSTHRGFVWLDDAVPLVFVHKSLYVNRGLASSLVRLGLFSNRFHSVPEHGSLSWSLWASYRVSNDAERHVSVPYVCKLAAAASRLAELGQSGDGTYRRLWAMEFVRALTGGIFPDPVRRALRPRHARARPESHGLPTAQDEPLVHGS